MNEMKKQKSISFWIVIIIVGSNISFCILSTFLHLIFQPREVTVDERIHILVEKFIRDKNKYMHTVEFIKKIDIDDTLSINVKNSSKEFGYWIYYRNNRMLNDKFPFFSKEMKKIWVNEGVSAVFNKKNIVFSICTNQQCADLIYTELNFSELINCFNYSMECCEYPQIPISTEHWIVKLEDKWYLFDGWFPMTVGE